MISGRDLAPQFLQIPNINVHLDPNHIDSSVRAHGTRFVHFRGLICPVGKVDPHDQRQPHPDHEGCSNGHIYTRAGVVLGLLVGNSKEKKAHVTGWLDAATAQLTVPRTYEDSADEVLLAPGDRLQLEDEGVLVTQSETRVASLGPSDRASRPIAQVLDLVDWTGQRLREGADFEVRAGRLAWTGRRPALDPRTGKAPVFALRYLYAPSWFVVHLTHELRLGQAQGATGQKTIRLPQSAMIAREYLYESGKRDPKAIGGETDRQGPAPEGA